jgi:hypothetical protein
MSSTEAEYINRVVEGKHGYHIHLRRAKIYEGFQLFIQLKFYVDNVIAMYLAKNTIWTEHMDIRDHFIKEDVNNAKSNIKLVLSENNTADLITKNFSGELFH